MNVYLDTEFTDFKGSKLISIGLVTGDGERSFYAELTDNYAETDCSHFVLEIVLPLLDAPDLPSVVDCKAVYARMTTDQCRQHLTAWFAAIPQTVTVVTDSTYDQEFLRALFRDHPWPANVGQYLEYVAMGDCEWECYGSRTERMFKAHPEFRRHHALDDAKVMMKVMEER